MHKFSFLGFVGKLFLRFPNGDKIPDGLIHGKESPFTFSPGKISRSWVTRYLLKTTILQKYLKAWCNEKQRFPFGLPIEGQVHLVRPPPQPNIECRVKKIDSKQTAIFHLNTDCLVYDSAPSSKYWEAGCEFANSTGGLYAMALSNIWQGGISGNETTGATAIFIGRKKENQKEEYMNKLLYDEFGWKLSYASSKSKFGLLHQRFISKQSIRVFIHYQAPIWGAIFESIQKRESNHTLYFADGIIESLADNIVCVRDYHTFTKGWIDEEHHKYYGVSPTVNLVRNCIKLMDIKEFI